MTTPKGPSKPGVKPFLGDDDLSELDAWVETFDALHGGPELAAEPPTELDSTQLVSALAQTDVTPPPDGDLDAPPDLLDLPEPSAPRPDSNPAARSFDLGRAPSVTAIDSEPDEGAAFGSDDEDEVFTSASRPGATAPDDALFDDDIAPPPAPAPRRGPAIVRRKSAQTPTPPADHLAISEAAHAAIDHDAMFSEQTRVADFGELDQRLFSSREIPAVAPDDDYLDIEVSDEKAGAPEVPVFEPFPTGRRTAHVVRRTEPGRGPSGQRPVVELDLEDDLSPARPASQPASEDDFSDVAAAVGASDDLAVPDIPRRRSVARGGSIPEIAVDVRPRATLDDALAGLRNEDADEYGESHPFDQPRQFGDEFGDPDQFDGPDQFANPQPFDETSGFDDEFEDPAQFQPAPFGQANQFADPNQFDEPQHFDEPNRFAASGFDAPDPFADPDQFDEPHAFDEQPAAALPPIAPLTPPPGDRPVPSGAVRRHVPSSETVRGMSISQIAEAGMLRPPAITDLYPRVKTPTSVPPIGSPAPAAPAGLVQSRTILEFGLPSRAARPSQPPPQPPPLPPVSQPGLQIPALPSQPPRSTRLATPLPIDPGAAAEIEPGLDLESIARSWPEQAAPLPTATLDEACAQALLVYDREIAAVDDGAASAALRVEAGRLCERLTDFDRARGHYDAALMLDPRATAALRGMRRLARTSGDLTEAIQLLDAEIAVAGALERRPLSHYRVDLMMASNEQDLARVAAGEILDQAPSDVRALLAQLELAFLDGRADEFGVALEQLAQAVSDHELRAALQSARGVLAAHHNDTGAAAGWFAAAAESDPTALAALLGAIRQATAASRSDDAARALLELARQIEPSDPITAAAAAIRAHQWAEGDTGVAALALAAGAMPSDPLVARLAAHHADAADDPVAAANAFIHWAHNAGSNAERAYAAARAAELDPGRGNELWASAIALDPGDDYAAAQLRTAHVAADATQAAIDVDLEIAADGTRERARLRAAYGMIAQGQLDGAIEVLHQGRAARPASVALSDALGEALAAAGKWTERARLFAELADEPDEHLDKDVAQLRSALAWEEAVGAAASAEDAEGEGKAGVVTTTAAALDAWERVLERGSSPSAHAAAIVLASRLGDSGLLGDALVRAQAAERLPLAATSLALRRARLVATEDPHRHETILRELQTAIDDPRRTVGLIVGAARRQELGDAAAALEERAQAMDARGAATASARGSDTRSVATGGGDHAGFAGGAGGGAPRGSDTEVAALRLRAAQLALDAGEAARATALLLKVEQALPQLGIVPDLLAAARRRAGDRPLARPGRRPEPAAGTAASAEAFARIVRDADLAMSHGDAPGALVLYQRALELRPGDPLAAVPLVRVATQLREPAPLSALALAQLRVAEEVGDRSAKAAAYELLARIDGDLRADAESAQHALESAAQADPTRIDLLHQLERHYAAADQLSELIRLRAIELDATPDELTRDRVALLIDLAGIASRDGRPELELADLYRRVLAIDPRARLALLHLESIVRRSGFSPELAELEDRIAGYFGERRDDMAGGDPDGAAAADGGKASRGVDADARTQAAFWTRAGETLAEIGKIDEAVQRFGKAEAALPGHVPALEGWRQAALKGQLWVDVAEAATRQAAGASGPARAALHHFAGVALMDKALSGEQAMAAFRRALEADHGHRDAFLRLRILLEEDASHDELATLFAMRLEVETDPVATTELHRALAELHRNFLSDRDSAKRHYRAILGADPNDLRAHAAIADIAWEQGNWQEAADALMARARLERAPDVLKTLCFRLGLIYADRLVDVPMALKAFQRALTYQPDDENTLIRLADLATQVGEWKLALGACERLVKNESDPDRRATHLHRVAKIFKHGFGDNKRAERALNLALDGAPTNDEALAQLVQFYRDANDLISVRVHLNRVAGAMRARVAADPQDGVAYRVISRAMSAREAASVPGSLPIARAAGEIAELLGTSGDSEQRLLQASRQPDLSLLTRSEADDVLFPRGVPSELRQIFQLLGDRIAKHVGIELRPPYGVTRGDRLRGRDNPVAAVAQAVASGLGFGEIDVYISNRQPWVMVAEPTSPVSLVIGSSIANAGGDTIRFAAGGALKLAQAHLAIAARLPVDDLGVLVVALLRLFQADFPIEDIDADAVAAQTQKLRRLIPTGLMNELKPFALAIDAQRFRHTDLARDLKIAGLRAGLVASGSLLAGLRILASQVGGELPAFLADPVAQGLVAFALGEDHAVVAR